MNNSGEQKAFLGRLLNKNVCPAGSLPSVPGGRNSGACRVADDCGLKNFSTFGCKIGNNLGDKKKHHSCDSRQPPRMEVQSKTCSKAPGRPCVW